MGHLKPFKLLGEVPPGTCSMCATEHDSAQPHNLLSLAYQYKFYDEYGRWPTWEDAMAHCSKDVQAKWIKALKEYGIDVGGTKK